MLLFDRSVTVRFPGNLRDISGAITYAEDRGPRIAFDFERSIRAEPDRGTVRIWNLPRALVDQIVSDHDTFRSLLKTAQTGITSFASSKQNVAATASEAAYSVNVLGTLRVTDKERATQIADLIEQHIVEVHAGYGDDVQRIFRGDIITIKPHVRDGLDYYTEIELGDGFVALQEQWMAATMGVGETPLNIIAFTGALISAGSDDGKIRAAIALVAPNAITAKLNNQWVGQGRPIDAISEVADFLKLTWWVRDGQIEFVERGKYLRDFAVALDADRSLISTSVTDDGRYRAFECILAPQVHPGRAVQITDEFGKVYKTRVLETKISGDTHGDTWRISGIGGATDYDQLALVEPALEPTGPRVQYAPGAYDRLTDPATGGRSIPDSLKMKEQKLSEAALLSMGSGTGG